MVIIFYDSDKNVIYLCTERDKMKILPVDEPNLLSHIPNDDILYVQNAHFITKNQFNQWLEGEGSNDEEPHRFTGFLDEDSPTYTPKVAEFIESHSQHAGGQWIHPCHNGAIHIADIKTEKYPNGVELIGKYDFVPVEALGGFETLEESMHFKHLLGKGKIEVVGYEYVKKNYGKKKTQSASDAALDRIIIKNDARGSAESIAAQGGIQGYSGAIEVFVE